MKFLGQFRTQLGKTVLRKPLLVGRLALRFAQNRLGIGSPILRTMDVGITTECNCRCQHCFAQSFKDDARATLSMYELKTALGEAVKNGVCHFSLQGGEPFLHPELDAIIRACKPHLSYITIVTNGTNTDRAILERVHRLGVDKIAVSIDSYYAREHDKFRGMKGCHEKAMATLLIARGAGLEVSMAVTVTKANLYSDSIQKLFRSAEWQNISVDVNIPQVIGNWDGRTDLLLDEADFKYLEGLHRSNIRIRRDLYYHLGRSGCPAVKEALYMNVYGDIFPCVFMQIGIGNIRQKSLRDIRRAALRVKEFSEYSPRCLAGEDRAFIDKYISQGFGKRKPVDGNVVFGLGA